MANAALIADLQARINAIVADEGIAQDGPSTSSPECPDSFPVAQKSHRKASGFSIEKPEQSVFQNGVSQSDPASASQQQDGPDAAFKKIVALVNVADRSELSIRNRLAQAGFSEESIQESVSRAKEYGFIDDARYADVLIRSRISQNKGSSGIERELKEQGIDPSNVNGWPYEYDVSHEAELDRAIGVLERKPPRSKNPRESAYRRLMQKGYPSSVSSSAVRIWCESQKA